jgi:hypothetical protein
MKNLGLLAALLAAILFVGALGSAQPAFAAFHLMRIHAVMGGLNGDNTVQYVELRMCSGGQNFVGGHTLKFYDGSDTLKATFTFPSSPFPPVPNASLGESILIATSEFNTASIGPGVGGSGGDADFTFIASGPMTNTVASNGGDALHPIQGINGKVRFGHQEGEGCDANFVTDPHDIDSVAYGTATADIGSAAPALSSPSDATALRESDITGPVGNNTDYSLQPTSSMAKTVAIGSLTTDLDTPRNNSRQVATFTSNDDDNDGVCNPSAPPGPCSGTDLCPSTPPLTPVDADGCSDGQVDGDADGICNPGAPSAGPAGCTGSDNCPTTANPGQANVVHPGTTIGDACEDPDADGDFDANDNCPDAANPGQENFDGDSQGDACDSEDDGDGYSDEAEAGTPVCVGSVNDDNGDDGLVNDGCPAIGPAESVCTGSSDEDGDGRINDGCPQVNTFAEGAFDIGTNTLARCSEGIAPEPSPSWPSDFVSASIPNSTDKVNILDLSSFIAPSRHLDTSPGNPNFNARWDLGPGRGVFSNMINVSDMSAMIAGSTGFPAMFGGAKAFGGPVCTGP